MYNLFKAITDGAKADVLLVGSSASSITNLSDLDIAIIEYGLRVVVGEWHSAACRAQSPQPTRPAERLAKQSEYAHDLLERVQKQFPNQTRAFSLSDLLGELHKKVM
jgi:hypothetical protein